MSGGFPPVWETEAQLDWSTPTYPAQLVSFDQLSPTKSTTTHRSGDAVNICATGDGFAEFTVYPTTFYVDVGNAAAAVSINGPASIHDIDPPHTDYTAWVTDPYGKSGDRTSKATWASSAPAVASIDANGAVVPHAKGTFTLTGTVYTKSGSGTLTLLGANTYSGATTISAGTVTLGNSTVATGSILSTSSISLTGSSVLIMAPSACGCTTSKTRRSKSLKAQSTSRDGMPKRLRTSCRCR